MNNFFVSLVFVSFAFAVLQQSQWAPADTGETALSPMEQMSHSIVDSAKSAVELSSGFIGIMAFFLAL